VKRQIAAALLLCCAGTILGCKRSPKQAREELARLNVPFTSEEFIGRCARGPTDLIETFLVAGADPNVVVGDAKTSYTPLMSAAEAGRLDIAGQLIAAGARADLETPDGRSALTVAAGNCKNPGMAKLLIDRGARPSSADLFRALWSVQAHPLDCSRDHLQHLLNAAGDVNGRNQQGWTLLMLAADRVDVESVRLILRRRPALDLQAGPYHWTALAIACRRALADRRPDTLPIVVDILRAGADPNLTDSFGKTPLESLGPASYTPELNPIREAITRPL
jgi:ankyrin repeat protein